MSEKREAYTLPEIEKILNGLSNSEVIKISKYAKYICHHNAYIQPDELLSEAVCSLLDGTRKWYKDANITNIFQLICGIMRSIRYNLSQKEMKNPLGQVCYFDDIENTSLIASFDNPEYIMIAEQTIEFYESEFEDEKQITRTVFLARINGDSPSEIRCKFNLNEVEYNSTMKAIRRKINKINNGGRS